MLDRTDLAILKLLQENARTSNAEIARRIGMAPSATLERVRKLEQARVIEHYAARVRPEAVGLGLVAFVFVRTGEPSGFTKVGSTLARLPEVQEVHHVAGQDCYLVKVRASSPAALAGLLRDRIGCIASVESTRTTVVLETLKETGVLPLPSGPARG